MLPWGDELQASPIGFATPGAWVPGAGPGYLVAEWASLCLDANQYHSLPCASSGP